MPCNIFVSFIFRAGQYYIQEKIERKKEKDKTNKKMGKLDCFSRLLVLMPAVCRSHCRPNQLLNSHCNIHFRICFDFFSWNFHAFFCMKYRFTHWVQREKWPSMIGYAGVRVGYADIRIDICRICGWIFGGYADGYLKDMRE